MATNSADVVAGTNATNTQYNNLRKDHLAGTKNITDNAGAATVTCNLASSNIHNVTLDRATTILALSNASVGQVFTLRLIQDGTGGRLVTWFSTIKWVGASAPTLSTAANAIDAFAFICTSAGNYDGYYLGFGLA